MHPASNAIKVTVAFLSTQIHLSLFLIKYISLIKYSAKSGKWEALETTSTRVKLSSGLWPRKGRPVMIDLS